MPLFLGLGLVASPRRDVRIPYEVWRDPGGCPENGLEGGAGGGRDDHVVPGALVGPGLYESVEVGNLDEASAPD